MAPLYTGKLWLRGLFLARRECWFHREYPHQPRASHRPQRMGSTKLNALPYRSTRCHRTHLRTNMKVTDIRLPPAPTVVLRMPMGNEGAKPDLRKSLRRWRECQTVWSGVDRMWALQRFRSVEPRDYCLQSRERSLMGSHITRIPLSRFRQEHCFRSRGDVWGRLLATDSANPMPT